jgi:hypothetical protein
MVHLPALFGERACPLRSPAKHRQGARRHGAGGKYTVWNGKQGKHEFAIPCRNRKQAEEIAKSSTRKDRPKEIEVSL